MSQNIDDCLWIKNIATLNVNGVDYRFTLWGVNKNEAANILINSVLEDKGILSMDFGANKTPVKGIKEGTFGEKYFREIYSGANGR